MARSEKSVPWYSSRTSWCEAQRWAEYEHLWDEMRTRHLDLILGCSGALSTRGANRRQRPRDGDQGSSRRNRAVLTRRLADIDDVPWSHDQKPDKPCVGGSNLHLATSPPGRGLRPLVEMARELCGVDPMSWQVWS